MQLMHENDHYKIVANIEGQIYQVISLETGIIEFEDKIYPKCLIAATEYSQRLSRFAEANAKKEVVDASNIVPIR